MDPNYHPIRRPTPDGDLGALYLLRRSRPWPSHTFDAQLISLLNSPFSRPPQLPLRHRPRLRCDPIILPKARLVAVVAARILTRDDQSVGGNYPCRSHPVRNGSSGRL